jgi:WD40 domain-containing protein/TIR domain-containing protein
MPGTIFISCRRGDEPGFAHALYARLEQAFPAKQLFIDVEGGLPAGVDFVEVLEAQVAQCDVLLALIGQEWLTARDDTGGRRLDSPDDFVRIEIESALRLGKRVIPVLVNKAEMPRATDLPSLLQPLARRNAVRLTQERLEVDVQGLIVTLQVALREAEVAREAANRAAREATVRLRQEASKTDVAPWAEKPVAWLQHTKASLTRWLLRTGKVVVPATVGAALIVSLPGNPIPIWSFVSDDSIRTFKGHSYEVNSVVFSRDGRTALSGSNDQTLKLWEVATGKELHTFTGHQNFVWSVAFSPDGRTALSSSYDKTLKLWEVATGKELRTFTRHLKSISSVAFSPDGLTALSGSEDQTLKLWEVATGKELRTFTAHHGPVQSVAFSPDGRTALSGGGDQAPKLWEVATGRHVVNFGKHSGFVSSVAFSPDGRTALSSSWDGTLKLWEVGTGKELRTFKGQSSSVRSVAFAPDGRTALSGGFESIKLWDLTAR